MDCDMPWNILVGFVDKYAPVCLNGDTCDCSIENSWCEIIVNSGKCEKCVSCRDTLRKAPLINL